MPNPTQTQTSDEAKMLDYKVLQILLRHRGKDLSIDRWDLVQEVYGEEVPIEQRNDSHHQDRLVRSSVSRLRIAGNLICDLGNGEGRWIAANPEEFRDFFSYYVSPIKARADVLKAMKKSAQQQWPDLAQPSLFDLSELELV